MRSWITCTSASDSTMVVSSIASFSSRYRH
jgi:hypothetical protein